MKHIKKRIKKEREKLLAEDAFVEDVLFPLADNNVREIGHECVKNRKPIVIMTYLLLLVITVFTVIGVLYHEDDNYSKTYDTRTATLAEVNDSLVNTQLSGEYGSIMLTYETKKETPMYFILVYEDTNEINHVFCRIDVIVNEDYPYEYFDMYDDKFELLGYTVGTRISVERESFEEEIVYIYTVNAFMETDAEKYIFQYEEISLSDVCGFESYLESIITIKI